MFGTIKLLQRNNVATGIIERFFVPKYVPVISRKEFSHNVTRKEGVSWQTQDVSSCVKANWNKSTSLLSLYCDNYNHGSYSMSSQKVLYHVSTGQTSPFRNVNVRSLATRTGHKKHSMRGAVDDIPEQYIDRYHEENLINSGWLMRLANENGYLSWCRNTYLTTAVGAAMFVQSTVPYAREAAEVILMMGGLCLCTGTFSFIYNLWICRSRMYMGRITVLFNTTMAVLHLILWVVGVALYLGYVEEDDELHPHPHDV